MEQVITAKEIHADFYGAEERLFVDAVGISKTIYNPASAKADRLKKIGFGKSKAIKDSEDFHKKRGISQQLISAIEYFRTYYPQYKFITEDEVKVLCAKYGLLLGDAASFTADMPEKNLQDIERFKLRKEDWREKLSFSWYDSSQINRMWFDEAPMWPTPQDSGILGIVQSKTRRSGSQVNYDRLQAYAQALFAQPRMQIGFDPYGNTESKKKTGKEQPAFKICAPKEDFDTRGFVVQDGYKLIYDPIVLQPLSKDGIEGYLIVTAWGDEASDEIVINHTSN